MKQMLGKAEGPTDVATLCTKFKTAKLPSLLNVVATSKLGKVLIGEIGAQKVDSAKKNRHQSDLKKTTRATAVLGDGRDWQSQPEGSRREACHEDSAVGDHAWQRGGLLRPGVG